MYHTVTANSSIEMEGFNDPISKNTLNPKMQLCFEFRRVLCYNTYVIILKRGGYDVPEQFSRENKADMAYNLIKEKIMNFEFSPGDAITELELCQQLDMSRTPIRIAMARLASDGFISEIGPKKSIVADISIDNFIHIYQIRESLDILSARTACCIWQDGAEIETLRKMVETQKSITDNGQIDSRAFLKLDRDFHRYIAKMARNPLLYKQLAYIHDLYWRYNFYSMYVTGSRSIVTSHMAIVDAIEHRDEVLAEAQVKEHLQITKDHILVGIATGFTPGDMGSVSDYVLH